jgi:hypothetical protein
MRSPPSLLLAGVITILALLTSPALKTRADETLVVSSDVMADFAQYKALRRPLYFAVSKDGLFSWYTYCMDYNCQASQSYRREVLANCADEGGTECVIFAVADKVQVDYRVGDPATMQPAATVPCTIDSFASGSPGAALVAPLRPGACNDFRRFGYHQDFKAFATSDLAKFRSARGWASRYDTPEEAIAAAMDQCAQSRKYLAIAEPCEVLALGDIVVRGMTEAQRRAAVAVYKKNKDATNADLPPG